MYDRIRSLLRNDGAAAALDLLSGGAPASPGLTGKASAQPKQEVREAGTPPAGGQEGGVNLTKAEYEKLVQDRAERDGLKSRVTELEQNWDAARTLIRRTGKETPEQLETSYRRAMEKAGYDQTDIDTYIETEVRGGGAAPAAGKKGKKDDAAEEQEGEVDETTQRLEQVEIQQRTTEKARLTTLFNTEVASALDQSPEIGTLVRTMTKLAADDSEGGAGNSEYEKGLKATIRSEISSKTREGLRLRSAQNRGGWNDGWVPEEAAKAAKAVYGKYKGLLPQMDRLAKAPSLGGGEGLERRTPVAPPSYAKGKSLGEIKEEATSWAADHLLRAIEGEGRGDAV